MTIDNIDISLSPQSYSPHPYPARPGECVVMSTGRLKGYAGVLVRLTPGDEASVRLLDAEPDRALVKLPLKSLIPTGKTPADLMRRFESTDDALTDALEKERQQVDYSTIRPTRKSSTPRSTKPKAAATIEEELLALSSEERQKLAELLMAKIAVAKPKED